MNPVEKWGQNFCSIAPKFLAKISNMNDEKITKRVYNNSSIPQQNRLRPEWQDRPDLKRDEVRRK